MKADRIAKLRAGYGPSTREVNALLDCAEALALALPHLEAVAHKDNAAYALARAALARLNGDDHA